MQKCITHLKKVRINRFKSSRRIVSVSLSLGRAINILRGRDKSEPTRETRNLKAPLHVLERLIITIITQDNETFMGNTAIR